MKAIKYGDSTSNSLKSAYTLSAIRKTSGNFYNFFSFSISLFSHPEVPSTLAFLNVLPA